METQSVGVLAMIHLVMLAMWGGVVATEAVIEVAPFRHRELHPAAIRFHFWIDLLVELPLVLAVLATGTALAFTIDPFTPLHLVKIGLGGMAVAINFFCIVVVVRRGRELAHHAREGPLWRASQVVLACFAAGLLCAAGAAVLGFRFALDRMVVGHAVQDSGISSACGGRVWRVDVGMSSQNGGESPVLELPDGRVRVLDRLD